MHPRWYQLPKGREITFDPASTINIELHNAAVDAYVNESLEYRRIQELTAVSITIGQERPSRGM